jgi:hypothetical protein
MPPLARLVAVCTLVLAACGAAPAPVPVHNARPVGERCDAACWRTVLGFLAESCACKTQDCSTAASKRMVAWVSREIIDRQHLTPHEEEVELMAEFQPYWDVEAACDARFFVTSTRHRPFVDGRRE